MKIILVLFTLNVFSMCSQNTNEEHSRSNIEKTEGKLERDKLKVEIYRVKPNNQNFKELGFYEYSDDYEGAISICIINPDTIVISDSYYKNIKIFAIKDEKVEFVAQRDYNSYLFTPGNKIYLLNGEVFITDFNSNKVLIESVDFDAPNIISFSKNPATSYCSISVLNDSIYLTSSYSLYDEMVYDVYSVRDEKFYRNERDLFEKLNNQVYSQMNVRDKLIGLNEEKIKNFMQENWVIDFSELITEKSTYYSALAFDSVKNEYLVLVVDEVID